MNNSNSLSHRSYVYKPIGLDSNPNTIRRKSIEKIIQLSPNLLVEVITSPSLNSGRIFKIGPLGLISDSLNKNIKTRNKQDGITYFGYTPVANIDMERQVDIQIAPKDKEDDTSLIISQDKNTQNKYGKFFQIAFNPDHRQYYLKDCGTGFGTFVKIQSEFLMKDNLAINIGNTYICTKLTQDESLLTENNNNNNENKEYNLTLRIYSNNNNSEYYPMNFQPSKTAIKIGRDNSCEVPISDILTSRVHCTIEFRKNIGWILRDGSYSLEKDGSITSKNSTNGTWVYASEDIPINEGLIFKLNNHTFQCNFSKD